MKWERLRNYRAFFTTHLYVFVIEINDTADEYTSIDLRNERKSNKFAFGFALMEPH